MAGCKIVTWDGGVVRTKDPIHSVTAPLIFLMELRAVIAFTLLILHSRQHMHMQPILKFKNIVVLEPVIKFKF